MSRIYNRRTWLSAGFHSHSYIACYFDANCPNTRTRNVLKIADCENVWTLYGRESHIESTQNIIQGLLRVLRGQQSVLLIRTNGGLTKHSIRLTEAKTKPSFSQALEISTSHLVSIIDKKKTFSDYKLCVLLHADEVTCDEEEWKSKLNILETELVAFHEFLSSQIP